MVRLVPCVGCTPHIVNLKPDSGDHPRFTDCFNGFSQSLRKQLRGNGIITHGRIPGDSLPFIPSAVDDKIFQIFALYLFQDPNNIFMGRTAPGRAVFVEHHGKFLFALRSLFAGTVHRSGHSLRNTVHISAGNGQDRCRRLKTFFRQKFLFPMSEVIICQASGQRHTVIFPEDLHLPGRVVREHCTPQYTVFSVLYHQPWKKMVHRHGTDLSESFASDSVSRPGWFQVQLFQRITFQSSFHAPV